MNTQSVDPNLESFLKDPLQTKGDRGASIRDEELNQDDGEDSSIPITETTKNQIIFHFTNSIIKDPQFLERIMRLMDHLKEFTEKEAQEYLRTIRLADVASISSHSVTLILKTLSHYFVNPFKPKSVLKIINDPHIRSSLTNALSYVYSYLGNMSGAILFIIYSLDSYTPDILSQDINEPENEKTDNAGASIPPDVSS